MSNTMRRFGGGSGKPSNFRPPVDREVIAVSTPTQTRTGTPIRAQRLRLLCLPIPPWGYGGSCGSRTRIICLEGRSVGRYTNDPWSDWRGSNSRRHHGKVTCCHYTTVAGDETSPRGSWDTTIAYPAPSSSPPPSKEINDHDTTHGRGKVSSVQVEGVEPPRPLGHLGLNQARLPITPYLQGEQGGSRTHKRMGLSHPGLPISVTRSLDV